jgi:hypothetical protein
VTLRRTLHVDRRQRGGAASLKEVIAHLLTGEVGIIVLHRHGNDWDEYGVVSYLAGTWPQYLNQIEIRSISGSGLCAIWNEATGRFERQPNVRAARALGETGEDRGRVEGKA